VGNDCHGAELMANGRESINNHTPTDVYSGPGQVISK